MLLLLLFAFVSGLVTILAPCIWPLLPIILSSSIVQKGHARPLGITLGIMLSFAIFTLTISTIVMYFHFDPNILRLVAVVVIGFLGLTMVIPSLTTFTEVLINKISSLFSQKLSSSQGSSFSGGLITGLSLGIVWSPCAGPILASIATLAATSQVSLHLVLITIAYVTGVGIPLFFFAYGGQQLIHNTKFISRYLGRVQQVFGVLMILTALAIYTNYDKTIQLKLLDLFPQYSQVLTQFENAKEVQQQLDILKGKTPTQSDDIRIDSLLNKNYKAPEFTGITNWLNLSSSDLVGLSLLDLRGRVVLVDFWTYTCINCIRTLPHVTSWYDKYRDQGFVVVGVHTPEFEFEKKTENVENAIKQYNIHYPVAQDNDYATWNAYKNRYWPAKYLIDADGNIRYVHFGEGKYEETEQAIQELLREAGNQVEGNTIDMPDETPKTRLSPETYLGSGRMQYYYPSGSVGNGQQTFTLSDNLPENSFSFGGIWTITDEYAIAGKNAVITYNFTADKVFLVLRPGKGTNGTCSPGLVCSNPGQIKVFIDGKVVDSANAGEDTKDGIAIIDSDRLYNLIDLRGKTGNHTLRLEFDEGIQAFAFTFG